MATTHDWARDLQRNAEYLLSCEPIEIGDIPITRKFIYSEKDTFLTLVRALKPGKKDITGNYSVDFIPDGANIEISIEKEKMCRRITPEYECDPWLTEKDHAEVDSAAAQSLTAAAERINNDQPNPRGSTVVADGGSAKQPG